MEFADLQRNATLQTWRLDSNPGERAKADNIWFEERVSRLSSLATLRDPSRLPYRPRRRWQRGSEITAPLTSKLITRTRLQE